MNEYVDEKRIVHVCGGWALELKDPEDRHKFPHLCSRLDPNWKFLKDFNPSLERRWRVNVIHGEYAPGITKEFRGHKWDVTPEIKRMLFAHPWVDPIPFVRRTTEGSLRVKCCYVSIIEGALLTQKGRAHYRELAKSDVLHEALELSGYSLGT